MQRHAPCATQSALPPRNLVKVNLGGLLRNGHPLGVWAAGVLVGLRSLRREPVLGLKRLVLPVSYWRSREFGYAWQHLTCPPGSRVLDLAARRTSPQCSPAIGPITWSPPTFSPKP